MINSITGKWHENKTCPKCTHRHPPEWTCAEAKGHADANRVKVEKRTLPIYRTDDLADEMLDLLRELEDAVEALDGTSVENEAIVDKYRVLMAKFGGY